MQRRRESAPATWSSRRSDSWGSTCSLGILFLYLVGRAAPAARARSPRRLPPERPRTSRRLPTPTHASRPASGTERSGKDESHGSGLVLPARRDARRVRGTRRVRFRRRSAAPLRGEDRRRAAPGARRPSARSGTATRYGCLPQAGRSSSHSHSPTPSRSAAFISLSSSFSGCSSPGACHRVPLQAREPLWPSFWDAVFAGPPRSWPSSSAWRSATWSAAYPSTQAATSTRSYSRIIAAPSRVSGGDRLVHGAGRTLRARGADRPRGGVPNVEDGRPGAEPDPARQPCGSGRSPVCSPWRSPAPRSSCSLSTSRGSTSRPWILGFVVVWPPPASPCSSFPAGRRDLRPSWPRPPSSCPCSWRRRHAVPHPAPLHHRPCVRHRRATRLQPAAGAAARPRLVGPGAAARARLLQLPVPVIPRQGDRRGRTRLTDRAVSPLTRSRPPRSRSPRHSRRPPHSPRPGPPLLRSRRGAIESRRSRW